VFEIRVHKIALLLEMYPTGNNCYIQLRVRFAVGGPPAVGFCGGELLSVFIGEAVHLFPHALFLF
jgi:hypothetical protein